MPRSPFLMRFFLGAVVDHAVSRNRCSRVSSVQKDCVGTSGLEEAGRQRDGALNPVTAEQWLSDCLKGLLFVPRETRFFSFKASSNLSRSPLHYMHTETMQISPISMNPNSCRRGASPPQFGQKLQLLHRLSIHCAQPRLDPRTTLVWRQPPSRSHTQLLLDDAAPTPRTRRP
jgi:hypothetical protein